MLMESIRLTAQCLYLDGPLIAVLTQFMIIGGLWYFRAETPLQYLRGWIFLNLALFVIVWFVVFATLLL